MNDLSTPELSVDASGQVLLARQDDLLDPLDWTWAASKDEGANWREIVPENGQFSSADATSGVVYRAQEILPAKQALDVLQHEVVFSLSEQIADTGIATWTLTQPVSERNLAPIVNATLSDLRNVEDWSVIFQSTKGDRFEERMVMDDGFVETGKYLIDPDLGKVLQTSIREDAADLADWQSVATYFDTDRSLSVSEVVFDSGMESTTFEDTDGTVETVLTDALDSEPWRTVTTFFEDGVKSAEHRELDDGTDTISFSVTDCCGEVQAVSKKRSDLSTGSDTFVWTDVNPNSDTSLTQERTLVHANENLREEAVAAGVLSVMQATDNTDQFISPDVNEIWAGAAGVSGYLIEDAIL